MSRVRGGGRAGTLRIGAFSALLADVDGAPADAAVRRRDVAAWRDELNKGLGEYLKTPLTWTEDDDVVETISVSASSDAGVRLLAVYAERPELPLLDDLPIDLDLDPAWRDATAQNFGRSKYGQLLGASVWVPGDFEFTTKCPLPDGRDAELGSIDVLVEQLRFLNARTLTGEASALSAWFDLPADTADFLTAAQRGLARFTTAVEAAAARGVPLLLDD